MDGTSSGSQPCADRGGQDSDLEADRELVEPRGHCPVALEAVDPALHCVAGFAIPTVGDRRPPAREGAVAAGSRRTRMRWSASVRLRRDDTLVQIAGGIGIPVGTAHAHTSAQRPRPAK
ncbi:hypothetical protein GCM10010266_59960 [Streptomyces griseomycini]|nr:hypothetical protein GCM10010266_59960 [Streptomyces griseomycini]